MCVFKSVFKWRKWFSKFQQTGINQLQHTRQPPYEAISPTTVRPLLDQTLAGGGGVGSRIIWSGYNPSPPLDQTLPGGAGVSSGNPLPHTGPWQSTNLSLRRDILYPSLDRIYPLPHRQDLDRTYPPSFPCREQTNTSENITFPHTTYMVGNNTSHSLVFLCF